VTLREGRAELHDRLNAAAHEGRNWTRKELTGLLTEARDTILTCPVEGCAYCWNVTQNTREEQP
jgi:hypothetical protein